MKRFVVVGLGIFGSGTAEALFEQGQEVIAIDKNEDRVNEMTSCVSRAVVGDARRLEVLKRIGAEGADAAIVSTGSDMSASILAVMALRDLGIERIYVKVISLDHARVMQGLGITEIIFPERESAMNLAVRVSRSNSLRNYIRLGHGFSLQEMAVPRSWQNQTLRDLGLTKRFRVAVVAIYDSADDRMIAVPDPDQPLLPSYMLIVTGTAKNLDRVSELE